MFTLNNCICIPSLLLGLAVDYKSFTVLTTADKSDKAQSLALVSCSCSLFEVLSLWLTFIYSVWLSFAVDNKWGSVFRLCNTEIFSFLTAWHLQTAASFKLFSFAGSAARASDGKNFALHWQRSLAAKRERGKEKKSLKSWCCIRRWADWADTRRSSSLFGQTFLICD